jgi:hypothetical protein
MKSVLEYLGDRVQGTSATASEVVCSCSRSSLLGSSCAAGARDNCSQTHCSGSCNGTRR